MIAITQGRPLVHGAARTDPTEHLGKVLSVDQVGSFGLEPVGYALAGQAAAALGPKPVLVAGAAIGIVTTLGPLAVPGVSTLSDTGSRRRPQPGK